MSNKSSYGRSVKKPNRCEDSNGMIVKCSNENCIEEGTIDKFRLCTRCSAYYCYHCCGLSLKIIKLLNDRNNSYWFCPDCAKPALTAIFIEKDIEKKFQNFVKTLEPRIIKLENDSEEMSNLLRGKVVSVKFSEHFQQNTTKIEELESIPVVYNNSESNVSSEILINDSVYIPKQISKSINNRVERANNVIVFNLKEQDDKQKDKVLVSDLCSFIIGKETSFKCTRLGSVRSTSIKHQK